MPLRLGLQVSQGHLPALLPAGPPVSEDSFHGNPSSYLSLGGISNRVALRPRQREGRLLSALSRGLGGPLRPAGYVSTLLSSTLEFIPFPSEEWETEFREDSRLTEAIREWAGEAPRAQAFLLASCAAPPAQPGPLLGLHCPVPPRPHLWDAHRDSLPLSKSI